MRFQGWWQRKNRRAKAVTVLAALLILQVGLCFGTPVGVSWYHNIFPSHSSDPLEAIGYMVIEALACILTLILVFLAAINWLPGFRTVRARTEDNR